MTDLPVPHQRTATWENEGGSLLAPSDADVLGVIRVPTETFKVGEYTYTNLADAVAQARRMRAEVPA